MHVIRQRLPLKRRCFVGILLDAFFSHYLTRDWSDCADEPLPQLVEQVYGTLRTASPLPERPAHIVPRVAARNRLGNYREFAVLREVLDDMS